MFNLIFFIILIIILKFSKSIIILFIYMRNYDIVTRNSYIINILNLNVILNYLIIVIVKMPIYAWVRFNMVA